MGAIAYGCFPINLDCFLQLSSVSEFAIQCFPVVVIRLLTGDRMEINQSASHSRPGQVLKVLPL